MANALKTGDTVKLISGGVLMTVTRVGAPTAEWPTGQIGVAWFVGDTLHRDAFVPDALVPDSGVLGAR